MIKIKKISVIGKKHETLNQNIRFFFHHHPYSRDCFNMNFLDSFYLLIEKYSNIIIKNYLNVLMLIS